MNGRKWTESEDRRLRTAYPHTPTKEIAKDMRMPVYSLYNRAFVLGLKKSPEYLKSTLKELSKKLQESGQAYRFSKGHIPINKGKKMPEHVYKKVKATMFKKGHIPANHKPVGYERLTRDGYLEIKVSEPNKFVLKHRLVWEQVNGAIPRGYNIQFRDGNRQNIAIENLYLISRSEQMKKENSMFARYPKEIQLAIQAQGALQRQINKRKDNDE